MMKDVTSQCVGKFQNIYTGSNPVLTTKNNKMEKIMSIRILRPITLPIIGTLLITYIIVAYVFDLEM